MTEFLNKERRDGLDTGGTIADRAIASIVDCYQGSLTNGNLNSFRELTDVSEKVDKACYFYAQYPETRSKAVNLRSWHIIRLITREYERVEPGGEWSYMVCGLSAADDFDRQVYPTTEALLKKVANTDLNASITSNMVSYDPEKNFKEHLLLADENKAILKREWCYAGTEVPHTAAFVVKAI